MGQLATLISIAMGAALLVWVICCGVHFVRAARRELARSGEVARVRCETCGKTYDVDAGVLGATWFSKSVTVTKTRAEGAALVDEPNLRAFSKKLTCPHCGQRSYARVLNANEINRALRPRMVRLGLGHLGAMLAGGIVILALSGVLLSIVRTQALDQAEQARAERYEELAERYL